MKRTLLGIAVLASAGIALMHTASAQEEPEPAPCRGVAAESDRIAGVLSAVPRYGSTYVLVVPERLADQVPTANAPGVAGLQTGVQDSEGAEAARAIGITRIRTYGPGDPLLQPLQDVADEKLDAAVLWAPLAGLGILELGLNEGQVALITIDKPRPAPPAWRAPAGAGDPCAAAILEALNGNGVLPAELLVTVDLRTLLAKRVPPFDLEQARRGEPLYGEYCGQCHGPSAVADPKGLAPVDLRFSIRRFSYPGFHYIVLNGRPSRSMPPLRGTVSDEQIALIYQYLKARSQKLLPAASESGAGGAR